MTTIAIKDGILAIDSAVNDNGIFVGETLKYVKKDGVIAAGCGELQEIAGFLNWVENGMEGKCECLKNSNGIIIQNGDIKFIDSSGIPYTIDSNFYAMGSGYAVALGAMYSGASAYEAVEAAKIVDIHTGGKIHEVKFK